MKAIDRCYHCHREFADHNYVPDSIDKYRCPVPRVETTYGCFTGGDPRKFHPDAEDCTPEELANHKRACEEADALESGRNLECPSGWVQVAGVTAHVLNAPFGIGCYEVEFETFFELDENWEAPQ